MPLQLILDSPCCAALSLPVPSRPVSSTPLTPSCSPVLLPPLRPLVLSLSCRCHHPALVAPCGLLLALPRLLPPPPRAFTFIRCDGADLEPSDRSSAVNKAVEPPTSHRCIGKAAHTVLHADGAVPLPAGVLSMPVATIQPPGAVHPNHW